MFKEEAGVGRIKIQFGVCQVGLGVPHSKGDVVKLEMPNWPGEMLGPGDSRWQEMPGRDVRREVWSTPPGGIHIWGLGNGRGYLGANRAAAGGWEGSRRMQCL